MASMSKHHEELTNGVGKCSVPMWMHGCPAGFCDKPAYGLRPPGETWRNAYTGERMRFDGRYNGYVPGLACVAHGGPEATHFGDPRIRCGIPHDQVPIGPCPAVIAKATAPVDDTEEQVRVIAGTQSNPNPEGG